MPRLPGISQKEAVRVFLKLGYRIVRESVHTRPHQRHHHGRDCS
jgi:predicted RNA binding protein YcfA (HicA-like mRNA interferase family)